MPVWGEREREREKERWGAREKVYVCAFMEQGEEGEGRDQLTSG